MTDAPQRRFSGDIVPGSFGSDRYLLRKRFFKLFGEGFHIFDPTGRVAFYAEMKAFRLKEDLRIYADEERRTELLSIRARSILDFGTTYDVTDARTGERVGALRRKGLRSLLRDAWVVLDANDREVGAIEEDNLVLALLRRFLINLVPQTFQGTLEGAHVFTFAQRFNPFILKLELDFTPDVGRRLDRRLGIAAAILLGAIEGRQD
ncbi:MAG: hypothetical protein L0Y64_07875 [Myxococcaceae bacterium]|nr:hypothetical protein [Myxococcaceae bacterium]